MKGNVSRQLKVLSIFLFLMVGYAIHPGTRVFSSVKQERDAKRVIRVGCELDYPPYCFVNERGEAGGFSVELFRAAAGEMGLEMAFKTGTWNKLKYDLPKGKLDALPLVGRTPEREKLYDFTFPYLTMHGAIVVRQDEEEIRSLAGLNGKEVAVMKGDNAEEYLRRINLNATIIQRTTFKRALAELSAGEHDAVVIQRLLALQLIRENGLSNLKVVSSGMGLYKQSFCFAVAKGDERLLSLLNEGLSIVNTNGTFRQLHAKWFAPLESSADSRQRIVIGGDQNYPPYEFRDENGQPTGYNVELMRAIGDQMGLSIEIRLGTWTEITRELENGQIDAIQGMLYSPERDQLFDMSPAHTNISYVIVARKGSKLPESLKALHGKSVLVQRGDLMHQHALNSGLKGELVPVETQEKALQMLSEGEYDYALTSRVLMHYFIEQNGWNNLVNSKKSVHSAEYCISVKNGNTALLSKLSEGLAALKASGEYRQIYSTWLGTYEEPKYGLKDILKYALYILVPLFLLLVASFVWSHTLNKKVAKRTQELREEITEREKIEAKLEKSERKYRQLFMSIRDAILVADTNRVIIDCNPAFEELFGYDLEEIKGKQAVYIFDDDKQYIAMGNAIRRHKGDAKDFLYKIDYRKKDNSVFHGEINFFYLEDEKGQVYGFIGLIRDITKREKDEQRLLEMNRELTNRNEEIASQNEEYETLNEELNEKNIQLERINHELEEAKEKAEESDRLKSAFLANMSHEIRTPMNGIMGFASLLENPDLNDERKDRYIEMIRKSGDRMLNIIGNLLDIAKIEAGQTEIQFEKTSVNEMMDDLLTLFEPEAKNKGLSLTCNKGLTESEGIILTDPTRLNQIMVNLINNALKYTNEGNIEFGYTRSNNSLRFFVGDTGIGISPDFQQKIFHRFGQAELTVTRDYEGAGLGLSISKAFAEKLGGEMWLDSTPGKGSIFYFTLPYQVPERQKETPKKSGKKTDKQIPENITLLVVEDEELSYRLLKEILQNQGVTFLRARNGKEAVEQVRNNPGIDLVLMDIKMPDMDGYHATRIIKKEKPGLPVIAQTAFALKEDRKKAMAAGCDDYLSKPIKEEELRQCIANLVQ